MRNPEMTKIRDRRMVETFYLLYDKKRIRLEDVLLRMSHDLFFLDQNYIYKRIFYISENLSYYEQLKEAKSPIQKRTMPINLVLFFSCYTSYRGLLSIISGTIPADTFISLFFISTWLDCSIVV